MKTKWPEIALSRLLDALEAEILNAPDAELESVVAETGSTASALLADVGMAFAIRSVRTDLYQRDKVGEEQEETGDALPGSSDPNAHPRSH